MKRRRILFSSVALFFLIGTSCARNPVTGYPELVLLSTESEQELGREARTALEANVSYVEDDELNAYLSSMVDRLAKHSPRQDLSYEVRILDVPELNAFALPGGFLFVTRGLLALANSEAEIAGVLGHEMAHVAAKHASQRIKRAAPLGIATGITSFAVGIVLPGLGDALAGLGGLANQALVAPYSRDQEREADEVGLAIASAAGWDPSALSGFLEQLVLEEQRGSGGPSEAGFLSTHPGTAERAQTTARLAAELGSGSGLEPSPAFFDELDGLVIGDNPAEGLFTEGGHFVQPVLGFAIDFPEAWKTVNARHQVAAESPSEQGVLALQHAPGDSARDAAHRFIQGAHVRLAEPIEEARVHDLDVARATVRTSKAQVDLTWVEFDGTVYLITGMATKERYAAYATVFRQAAESFRPATPEDRASVTVTRLRIEEAEAGETLEELGKRVGSAWDVEQLAHSNAIDPAAPLTTGARLKVALEEPYLP